MQDALDAAKQRLARGEITPDEYDAIARRLGDRPARRETGWPGLPVLLLIFGLGTAAVVGLGAVIMPQIIAQYVILIAIVAVVAIVAIAFFYFMGG